MTRSFVRTAIVLGLLTAVGPLSIDMYLPALPSMGRSLHAASGPVQLSLMVYIITIGVCQLLYGPASDVIGRKPPLYAGLMIFVAGSIGCALAPGIDSLIGFRVVQAAGACAGMVVPRAMVRDLHTGHQAAQLMSMLMLVVSLSPILAPLTGSFVIGAVGWRGVFAVLTLTGVIALLLAATGLKETRPNARRQDSRWRSAVTTYRRMLLDPFFMGLTLVAAVGMSAFFVYLGSASFVLIDHYGLTPLEFSLFFSLNAASYFGFSQLTGALTKRYGLIRVIRVSVSGFAISLCGLAVVTAFGADGLAPMAVLLFFGYGFLGIVLPATTVLALEHHGAVAGTASALMGAVRMVVGGASMAAVGFLARGEPGPMVDGIAACAALAFVIMQLTMRPHRELVSVPAE